jgi:hypothetical protein
MSASGGDMGSGVDMMETVGAVGCELIFYPDPEEERNFSATGSGFPVTSLHHISFERLRSYRFVGFDTFSQYIICYLLLQVLFLLG